MKFFPFLGLIKINAISKNGQPGRIGIKNPINANINIMKAPINEKNLFINISIKIKNPA